MEPAWIRLEPFQWSDDPSDKDANFKREVSSYGPVDPLPTIERMSRNLGIPAGAIARYILAKWAASGSEALLEIGPQIVRQMGDTVANAEASGTDEARLEAYDKLSKIIDWLRVPLDNPQWRPGGWTQRAAE